MPILNGLDLTLGKGLTVANGAICGSVKNGLVPAMRNGIGYFDTVWNGNHFPPPLVNPVLYLPDYPGQGSVITDYSGNAYNGTIVGAIWKRRPSGLYELTYDGNDYVELDAPLMNFTSGDFTIAVWVKTTNLTAASTILCRGLYNTEGYWLFLNTNGAITFRTSQAAANQDSISTAGAVITGNYYRLGAVRVGASVRIYKNGIDVTSTAASHINPTTCSRTVKIGIYDDKTLYPLIGQSGAVTVIPAALTPAQMLEDFQRDRWLYPA